MLSLSQHEEEEVPITGWDLESPDLTSPDPGRARGSALTASTNAAQVVLPPRQRWQHPWWTVAGFVSALAMFFLTGQGSHTSLSPVFQGRVWKSEQQIQQRLSDALPVVHLCGDSTMAVDGVTVGDPSWGWGQFVHRFVNLPINNKALSGRSTRTYTSEGDWDRFKVAFRPGDVVIMEHGLNDEGDPENDQHFMRNSLLDLEDENATVEVLRYGRPDIVHTYQWYVKRWIRDIRDRGAIPVLASPIGTNSFDGPNQTYTGARHWYPLLAERVAKEMQIAFVDHNKAQREFYEQSGKEGVAPFYPTPGDFFHLSKEGADKVAELFFAAFKCDPQTAAYKTLLPYFRPRASQLESWC